MSSPQCSKFETNCSEKNVFKVLSKLPIIFIFDVEDKWRIFTWPDSEKPTIKAKNLLDLPIPLRVNPHPSPIPFCSGYVGAFEYECSQESSDIDPTIQLYYCSQSLAFHHPTNQFYFYGTEEQQQRLIALLHEPPDSNSCSLANDQQSPSSSLQQEEYTSAVRDIQEAICNGEVYQINLSYKRGPFHIDHPELLWYRLVENNPSRHSFLWKTPRNTLLCNSPELFLQINRNGTICSSPIKGTNAHYKESEGHQELWSSEKEKAELTMIVDMVRNDLGKICQTGSIFTENRKIRRCGNLLHTEQTVTGILHPSFSIWEIIDACFPAASITGAPKIAAMNLIEQLEPHRRGPYTGSLGFIDDRGNAMFNVTIRTMIVNNHKGYFHIGAGIVHDSNPELEWQETKAKATAIEELQRNFLEETFPSNR